MRISALNGWRGVSLIALTSQASTAGDPQNDEQIAAASLWLTQPQANLQK
jgi:hypothetical protein